jgi:hemerythrin-like metal-binding protein
MLIDKQLLTQMINSSNDCYALLDRDYKFLRIGGAFARQHGKTIQFFLKKHLFDLFPADEMKYFEDVLASKKPIKLDARPLVNTALQLNKTSYWDWNIEPFLSQHSEVEALLLTGVNVTDSSLQNQTDNKREALSAAIASAREQLNSHIEPVSFLKALMRDAIALTDSEYGCIGKITRKDDEPNGVELYPIPGDSKNNEPGKSPRGEMPSGHEFTVLEKLFDTAARTGEVVISNDIARLSTNGEVPGTYPAVNSFLGVAVTISEEVIATLGLLNRPGGYDTSVVEFIQPLLDILLRFINSCSISLKKDELIAALRKVGLRPAKLELTSIEEEHDELIQLMNECYDKMVGETNVGIIKRLLDKIYSKIAEHFAHEEEFMQKIAYPHYNMHKASHEKLLLAYSGLVRQFVENPAAGMHLLQKTLADWLIRHMSGEDQQLEIYISRLDPGD